MNFKILITTQKNITTVWEGDTMIKIENVDIYGFEAAIRGMRNPKNSWNKMDSRWEDDEYGEENYILGPNDIKLAKTLAAAGNDHGKFLRMINVTCDITAPLYWWKEFDTYKVGTVADSCSTMHKIQAKKFELDDFSHEHLSSPSLASLTFLIEKLNSYRDFYNNWDDILSVNKQAWDLHERKDAWWQMIQLLPSSYNQKRTVQMNYQVLKAIYFARRNHKLDEWHVLCDWALTLPYFKDICVQEKKEDDHE